LQGFLSYETENESRNVGEAGNSVKIGHRAGACNLIATDVLRGSEAFSRLNKMHALRLIIHIMSCMLVLVGWLCP